MRKMKRGRSGGHNEDVHVAATALDVFFVYAWVAAHVGLITVDVLPAQSFSLVP